MNTNLTTFANPATPATARPSSRPSKALWTGRILSGLLSAFLAFDGLMKLVQPAPVMQASAKLGFTVGATTGIGIALLVATALYAYRGTTILGAMLLTGYLGGAVATMVRSGASAFETLFPVIFGILVWGSLYIRDESLRVLVPFRK
jgi:hypothetical protein